jgi:ABC-type multidrug transport system ATPase subunit
MNPSVLTVRALSRRFGAVRAVHDVGFSVDRGRVTALLGENGAGKSTTIRIVLGFLRRDGGEVGLAARTVGYVPEQPAFFPWARGDDLLSSTALLFGISRPRAERRVLRWCERLPFPAELLRRRVSSYSQGNRKKFAYLQSLVLEPDLFIADEPFAALDPASIRNARDLFRELAVAGCGVLLSSHLIAEIGRVYDDVVIIHRGGTVLRERREDLGPAADLEALFMKATGQEKSARAPASGLPPSFSISPFRRG